MIASIRKMCRSARGRAAAAVVLSILGGALIPAGAQAKFEVGLQDVAFSSPAAQPNSTIAYTAMNRINGSIVRIDAEWSGIAPAGNRIPAGFNPSNPADPRYRWARLDSVIRIAAQHHLRVMLEILSAPTWALGPGAVKPYTGSGAWNPNPNQFAAFMHAIAVRYGGSFPDSGLAGRTLPRVKYWEPWNEPNIPGYLNAPNTVNAYRSLLNAAYSALKAVHGDNVVALGGLAPVSPVPGSTPALQFAAQLMCVQQSGRSYHPLAGCPRANFDVVAAHPYSINATPTKHAYKHGDLLIGDVPALGDLVRAADRLHTAGGSGRHHVWVTEFAWFTNPPNSQFGDRERTAARYVAYAMYEMWQAGVDLVIWFNAQDLPQFQDLRGGGLYTNAGAPKMTLSAFAFPVVASVKGRHGLVWGRAPVSRRVKVKVQHRVHGHWKTIRTVRTGRDGIFTLRFRTRGNALYRARIIRGQTSLAYDSKRIPGKRTHNFQIF